MCGINGVVGDSSEELVGRMNDCIRHRGPDHSGVYTSSKHQVTLGLNRLSILDPTVAGHQPLTYRDVTISYNGEVYNYKKLREDLKQKGYNFKSQTDTEVILKGYVEYGDNIFKKLNGMFAIVLFDPRNTPQVIMARDRLGIKPLYYANANEKLLISSEQKSIREILTESCQLTQDGVAVAQYLQTKGSFETLIDEINSVSPGTISKYNINSKKLSSTQYSDIYSMIDPEKYEEYQNLDEKKLVDKLDRILNDAVKRQLVSDVPIATICSGGVDSSLVTAIASQYRPDIDVYHIRVSDDEMDESKYAKKVADYLDLNIHVKLLDKQTFLNNLERLIQQNDRPFTHPNSVGVGVLNQLANSNNIKVLLTGEGADELFGGYGRYKFLYRALKLYQNNFIQPLFNKVPGSDFILRSFLPESDDVLSPLLKDQTNMVYEDKTLIGHRKQVINKLRNIFSQMESEPELSSSAYIYSDIKHYLPPLLYRADRMSMQAGVEARVPMLDNQVLEFALNLPHEYKLKSNNIKNIESKYLLKKVAERYLPKEIVYRRKSGFPIPVERWLKSGGYTMQYDVRSEFYNIWKKNIN